MPPESADKTAFSASRNSEYQYAEFVNLLQAFSAGAGTRCEAATTAGRTTTSIPGALVSHRPGLTRDAQLQAYAEEQRKASDLQVFLGNVLARDTLGDICDFCCGPSHDVAS